MNKVLCPSIISSVLFVIRLDGWMEFNREDDITNRYRSIDRHFLKTQQKNPIRQAVDERLTNRFVIEWFSWRRNSNGLSFKTPEGDTIISPFMKLFSDMRRHESQR